MLCEVEEKCLEQRRKLSSAVSWGSVVFAHPPRITLPCPPAPDYVRSGINSGPYALEYGRRNNSLVIEYESWLMTVILDVDAVSSNSKPFLSSKKKTVSSLLDGELARLETLKMGEWMRRYDAQGRARKLQAEGNIDVVDTGTLISLHAYLDQYSTHP